MPHPIQGGNSNPTDTTQRIEIVHERHIDVLIVVILPIPVGISPVKRLSATTKSSTSVGTVHSNTQTVRKMKHIQHTNKKICVGTETEGPSAIVRTELDQLRKDSSKASRHLIDLDVEKLCRRFAPCERLSGEASYTNGNRQRIDTLGCKENQHRSLRRH